MRDPRWTFTPREPWQAGTYQPVLRSTSWKMWPAIRSAARSRSTTSRRSTRAPIRRRSRSPSPSECSHENTYTYELPAIGRPKARQLLPKVAVEERFPDLLLTTAPAGPGLEDLSKLVKAMDYDATSMAQIDKRLLVEIGPMRLAEMNAAGVDVCVLSRTVPGVPGMVVAADEAVVAARPRERLYCRRSGEGVQGPVGRVCRRGAPGPRRRPRAELERAVAGSG